MERYELPQAVLFDLDGVLIDSEETYSKFWRGMNEVYPTGIANFERVIKGTTLPDILTRYFPDPDVADDVRRRGLEFESHMVFGFTEGADLLLTMLESKGIKKAMVTSSDGVKMLKLERDLPGLCSRFDTVITGEDVTRSKPDPQGYLMAAQRLGADPAKCIVVEDALHGMDAGRAAGAFVVGLTGTLGRDAVEGHADVLIDSLTEFDMDKYARMMGQKQ